MTNPATADPPTKRRTRDVSLVIAKPKWRSNLTFVDQAIALNAFVSCGATNCGRVIGIGIDKWGAERDAADNNTGILTDDGWRCEDHSGIVVKGE